LNYGANKDAKIYFFPELKEWNDEHIHHRTISALQRIGEIDDLR